MESENCSPRKTWILIFVLTSLLLLRGKPWNRLENSCGNVHQAFLVQYAPRHVQKIEAVSNSFLEVRKMSKNNGLFKLALFYVIHALSL